ncbi:uncharacterized protein ACWYII_022141 [Salvelinus alpinus]
MARVSDAVKKKWSDIKSAAKKNGAERSRELKKTGGGVSTIHVDQLEEKVLSMIGEMVVEGLRSGIDSDGATEITLDLIHIPLSLDVGAMDHHDHTTEQQAEIITEDRGDAPVSAPYLP